MKLLPVGIAALLLLTGHHFNRPGQERLRPAPFHVPPLRQSSTRIASIESSVLATRLAISLARRSSSRSSAIPASAQSPTTSSWEFGNSRYQDLADRFIRGENVAPEALQQIWVDTTQQQVASLDVPEIFTTVRTLNASAPPDRRLRILLGEPHRSSGSA
jgi:hypothetical protein